MMQGLRRLMAGLIGLSLLLCVLPAMAESITYGVVTSDNVNVRRAGKISAKLWFQVDAGHVAQILSRTTAQEDGGVWYKVSTAHPQPNGHTYIGYIHGDFFRPMTQAETEQYLKGQGQLLPSSPPETDGGVQLSGARGKTLGGTNFRDQPSTRTGRIMQVIPGGTEIDILALPTGDGEWYRAAYKGVIGYVHTGMVRLVTSGETAEPEAADAVITTASGVNLRLAPGGKSIAQVPRNTVMTRVGPVLSPQESGTDYTWYGVRYEGMHGYIRGDCVREYTGGAAQEPSHPPAEDSDRTGTGRLLKNTNFRDQPTTASGSRIMAVIRAGTMVEVRSVPMDRQNGWYGILYGGKPGYVHASLLEMVAWDESDDDNADQKPSSLGYVMITASNVNLRDAAEGRTLTQLAKGTIWPMTGLPVTRNGTNWYPIRAKGHMGYVHGGFSSKLSPAQEEDYLAEGNVSQPSAPPPSQGNYGSAPQSQQETSYPTLRPGSAGLQVANLVAELMNQGYYTGAATSSYTAAVEAAVKTFQRRNGLQVDGIAGSKTQHRLFGTTPIGTGDPSDLSFEFYPVEKIDWYSGGIQQLIPPGANFKVYDVKTGIVWWAHRWAGNRHADIETLTAADSVRLCQIYGVDSLQEIVDKNLWQRRPCLITIGTRTFAASLDGMQHNPAGDTIPDNGMTGQICLHFTNSEGHASQAVSTSHREAIEYAYTHCPAGRK